MKFLYTTLFCILTQLLSAQLPVTQLYHFKLTEKAGSYQLSEPKWLNKFNPQGYNNQPFFFSEEEIYITARLAEDSTQTDIFALNLRNNILTRITETPESEYSAKPIPGSKEFSVVRVDVADTKIQRLWKYPLDRSHAGTQLLEKMLRVGYYHWISPSKVILFVVNEPANELYIADINQNAMQKLPFVPGRCFGTDRSGNVVFTVKTSETESEIHLLDSKTLKDKLLVKTMPGSEDFVIAEDGTFFMGNKDNFYKFNPKSDKNWVLVTSLREQGIKKIERLALNKSGDLVMVCR